MLELYNEPASRSTSSPSPSTCARAASSRRPAAQAEIDALAAAVPERRQRCATTRRSSSEQRAAAPAAQQRPTRSRPAVHSHEATPRDLVERAERAMLEVAHDDRQKDFRKVGEVLHTRDRQVAAALHRGPALTGTPSGFARPRRDHRRLPARQPDHHRRPPVDGQVGARHEHRRERRAGQGPAAPGRPVQPRDVRGRARPALHRVAGGDQGRRPAQGPAQGRAQVEARAATPPSASHDAPLFVDDSSDIGMLEIRAKARRLHQQTRPTASGLIIVDYLQLMRAGRADREPRPAGRRDEPRPEDPRARARGPGHRALAAPPRRRVAHRQAADALRPARVRARSSRTPTS